MYLFKYKWLVPVIAQIHLQNGGRFVSIYKEQGMSRSMLTSTLKHLINYGLIIKNPGYGHPLRPEFILTPLGKQFAPFCVEFMELTKNQNLSFVLQNRWAAPIIFKTGTTQARFNHYKKSLKPITSKALSESLNFLVANNFINKKIITKDTVDIIYELPKRIIPACTPYQNHYKLLEGHL